MRPFSAEEAALSGPGLCEASAGTGKTHAICTLLLRLIAERELDIERVLVVTFTEAATAELRARIRGRLRQAVRGPEGERYARALRNVDRAAVYTIHGFCHRTLLDSAFDSGARFDMELLANTHTLRDEVLMDFWAERLGGAEASSVAALRSQRILPSAYRGLVDRVTRAPAMPVLPPVIGAAALPAAGLERARDRARRAWDRSAVERLLVTSPALKRNIVRADAVPDWCAAMDAYLGCETAADHDRALEFCKRFAASRLRGATRAGFTSREPRHPFFDACDELALELERYGEAVAAHGLAFKRALVDYARRELPRRKERLGVLGFDDLLVALEAALSGPFGERLAAAVRARYPVALIDEFQDTDPLQWSIFRRIYGEGDVMLIGDPKQAIYAFRGADVFAYLDAARHVQAERRFTMDVNWRSDPGLVSAVGALFARVPRPFALEAIGFPKVHARPGAEDRLPALASLEVRFAARTGDKRIAGDGLRRLPHAIAADIADLLGGRAGMARGSIEPADIAVLTRTNRQAFDMQRALVHLGIRAVVLGDQSVFEDEQPDARELGLVLAAVAEPTDSLALRTALTTELMGVTASELAHMDDEEEGWERWVERFRALHELWGRSGFVQMFRALMREARVAERLLACEGGERRVTNLLHLMELLQTAASTQHLGPAGLLSWLAAARAPETAKERPETAQIRLESDERAVRITTVHRSKGLEYPIVYCPYLWDGSLLFPDDKLALLFHEGDERGRLTLDLGQEEAHVARAEWERFAENLRLAYVALTRARHRTVIVWGAFGSYDTSALGYLLHPPPLAGRSPTVAEVKAHVSSLSDERMLLEVSALAAGERIAVSPLDLGVAGRGVAPDVAPPLQLSARAIERPLRSWWRTASFSQLSSGAPAQTVARGEGLDRDEITAPDAAEPMPEPDHAADPITLLGFPRGPKAGDFFHDVLEHLDFGDDAAIEPLVADRLAVHGYGSDHAEVVCRALREVLATPLTAGKRPARLADIDKAARQNELEFYFPVANPMRRAVPKGAQLELLFAAPSEGSGAMGLLTADKLAQPFADHPSDELAPDYAAKVARLPFLPLEGFLKGYIDMVFSYGGRWYVVDYKTNHLGDDIDDYRPARLMSAMAHGHYYLQAHLYAVALHRHLARRLAGYRYDKHFGGLLYLFIKGMRGRAQSGVFFEKPPRARIEQLSELLDQPPKARGER